MNCGGDNMTRYLITLSSMCVGLLSLVLYWYDGICKYKPNVIVVSVTLNLGFILIPTISGTFKSNPKYFILQYLRNTL